jgi:RNA polymerase sigma-70 factor, ECF subfamily
MPDWPEILSRDGPAAWQTAYRILRNRADADECFQEACLAALNVSRRQPVRHWAALLKRLAAARAVDRLRQRARRPKCEQAVDCNTLDGPTQVPSERVEDAEMVEELRAALAKIPARQAELFCLHLENWTYDEIAREFDMSTNRVGVLLHRARKRLARLLSASLRHQRVNISGYSPGPERKEIKQKP